MQLVDEEQMAGYHKSQLGRIEHRFRHLFLPPPSQPVISLAYPTARRPSRRFRPNEEDGVIEVEGERIALLRLSSVQRFFY